MTTKICTGCRKELPIDSFHVSNDRASGRRPRCKECHKEDRRESDARYRAGRGKEYLRAYFQRPYAKEKRAERERSEQGHAYRAEVRKTEKYRATAERYRKTEKSLLRGQRGNEKRRSHQYGLPHAFDESMKARLLTLFGHRCAYCRCEFDGGRGGQALTYDHLTPVCRGDIANPGTVWGNMVPACRRCNSGKCHRTHHEWCSAGQIAFITAILEAADSIK